METNKRKKRTGETPVLIKNNTKMKTKTGNFYLETGEMQLTISRTASNCILFSVHGEDKDFEDEWEYNCASIVLNVAQAKELINELQNLIV